MLPEFAGGMRYTISTHSSFFCRSDGRPIEDSLLSPVVITWSLTDIDARILKLELKAVEEGS